MIINIIIINYYYYYYYYYKLEMNAQYVSQVNAIIYTTQKR